jgi:hypothetical protein
VPRGGIEANEPDALHLAACGLTIEPFTIFLAARSFGIALGQQLFQGVTRPLLRFYEQSPALDRKAHLGSGPQV